MFVTRYALIIKGESGTKLGTIGTDKEPQNKNGGIAPKFHTFCQSVFGLDPLAFSLETVAWNPGTAIEQAPVLVIAKRTEQKKLLSYSFPNGKEWKVS